MALPEALPAEPRARRAPGTWGGREAGGVRAGGRSGGKRRARWGAPRARSLHKRRLGALRCRRSGRPLLSPQKVLGALSAAARCTAGADANCIRAAVGDAPAPDDALDPEGAYDPRHTDHADDPRRSGARRGGHRGWGTVDGWGGGGGAGGLDTSAARADAARSCFDRHGVGGHPHDGHRRHDHMAAHR